jgi:hypothetical protein
VLGPSRDWRIFWTLDGGSSLLPYDQLRRASALVRLLHRHAPNRHHQRDLALSRPVKQHHPTRADDVVAIRSVGEGEEGYNCDIASNPS